MKIQRIVAGLIVLTTFVLAPSLAFSQISSTATGNVPTEYASGAQDRIHVFCGQRGAANASLTATSPAGVPASFEWLRYNNQSGSFDPYLSDASGATTSVISNLQDGAYRVNITTSSGVQTFTAWVFNNYIETTAAVTASDCNSMTLTGTSDTPVLTYTDLTTGQPRQLNKDIQVRWTTESGPVGQTLVRQVFSPPTKDTDYTLTVTDRFGCTSQSVTKYISIVTKASFTYVMEAQPKSFNVSDATKREAPLSVTFTNGSENGDAGRFEWFIFKSEEELLLESQANPGAAIDSFLYKGYSDDLTYVFEKPGTYDVKLVSHKKSEFHDCSHTFYIEDPITIEESFVDAPNFFSPGNGGGNDNFIVRFLSMKSIKLSIFNRWGKVIHVFENSNVQGFSKTWEASVWDGKIGGKYATPGVYYYVVEGMGRDDKRQKANGFFHLFREK